MQRDLPPVAVVQHDPTVGDVAGNREAILERFEWAADAGAAVVVTPELALLGYPPRDLLHREAVLDAEREALSALRRATADGPALVVGHTARNAGEGPPLTNSATVFADGETRATYAKRLLPTYDVFDEHRYFSPGGSPTTVEIDGATVGLTVCEDAWYDQAVTGQRRHAANPIAPYESVDLLLNLSASPFHVGKPADRIERFGGHAAAIDAPVVFANQVGGNDDILFDGVSFVVDPSGEVTAMGALGEADIVVERWDGDDATPALPKKEGVGGLRRMLAVGVRDYLGKTGFEDVVIGLSGGIDSSVAAAIAVDAVGPRHVYGVTLPSHVTAEANRSDAERVARGLGIEFGEHDIEGIAADSVAAIDGLTDGAVAGLTRENVQARVRGLLLMGVANDRGALVLTPDNKSEAAVGYCTLYGDAVGALAPLGDCTKRRVYALARAFNDDPPVGDDAPIPRSVLEKEPTAELAEGQTDADEIPPYEVIDPVVRAYVGGKRRVDEIVATTGADREQVETVVRRLTRSEFKREQSPPALRVTTKAFDSGWRYPIAASYEPLFEE